MPASSPSLAIIIVTYNSRDEIRGCLESVLRDTARTTTTVTVVDNASPDGTANQVRASWPQVHVIDAGGNVGFSRANNLGVRATSSDYVLFLNPDTVVQCPGDRTTLIDAARSRRRHGDRRAASGRRRRHAGNLVGTGDQPVGRVPAEAVDVWLRAARASTGRVRDDPEPAQSIRRMGQRRVPARPPHGSRGGRPLRRALFHVHRGCGSLHRRARSRTDASATSPTPRCCT